MTEAEWLACEDPMTMIEFLRGKVNERNLRLLGVAIARASWDLLIDERSRQAIEVAEQYADGVVDANALLAVVDDAWDVRDELFDAHIDYGDNRIWVAEAAGLTASVNEWNNTFAHPIQSNGYPFRVPLPSHCSLVRDIFGNPYRTIIFDPSWLTEAVVGLANVIYTDRAFERMPILADALQDAGCTNEDILNHYREPGEHVRGCWVVDLIIGKE